MSHRLWQAWRGTLAQVLGVTPADGEPLWDNVTKRLRIGDGSTAGGLRVVMKADKDAADYGLSFEGVVTTYTDTTHFKVSTLAGFGAEFFKPTAGAPYEIFVVQADNAAPEGEQTPVVAYTTADGTFEHAAFSVPLAVGDIVLIIHPLIASLGTKATAAAAGAVTTDDYAMAYIKQLVSAMIVVDGIVDNILDDTGTTIPGTITTLQAAVDAIQADLGDTGDTPVVGFPGTNAALAILKGLQVWQGGFVYGDITGYTNTTAFASTTLAAFETGFFNGWALFLAKDDAGAGATPQGARAVIDTFTTTTGAITLKSALPAAGAVGDHIILVHPILLDAWNMRGGVESLESLSDELDAIPDIAEVRTLASPVTLTNSYQHIYTNAPGRPFYFAGGFVSRASGAWTTESVEIVVEVKFDGTNWRDVWSKTITAEPSPVGLGVPADANSALLNLPKGFWNNGDGVRVGIKQSIEDGGYHTWAHSFLDAVVGT